MATAKGLKKLIATPEILWRAFNEYVKEELSNKIEDEQYVGATAKRVIFKHVPPLTNQGFSVYLAKHYGVSYHCYRLNTGGAYGEYLTIVTKISDTIFQHNFKYAAIGKFNCNLISRQLGLTEKIDQNIKQEVIEVNFDLGKKIEGGE